MHLILHWLANLTQQTKGSKFLRVGWRKVRNHHHYIWETKTNMSIQEWPSHHKFDTNSDQKCWNLKASDHRQNAGLSGQWLYQTGLLTCLPCPFLLVSISRLALSSISQAPSTVGTRFQLKLRDDTMKTGWIQVSILSLQPRSYSDLCLWLLQVRNDYGSPLEPATPGTSDSRDSWRLDWDCCSGRGILVNTGYWVKSGQIKIQELLRKMSWPVFYKRSSRWSVCPFWPLNLLIYFPFQEI